MSQECLVVVVVVALVAAAIEQQQGISELDINGLSCALRQGREDYFPIRDALKQPLDH